MKLKKISDRQIPTNYKLNFICDNIVCGKHINEDIYELFVKAAVRYCVLNEADKSLLRQLNEDQNEDIAAILKFLAPDADINPEDPDNIKVLGSALGIDEPQDDPLQPIDEPPVQSPPPVQQATSPADPPSTQQEIQNLRDTISNHIDASEKLAQFNQKLKKEIEVRQKELLRRLKEIRNLRDDKLPPYYSISKMILETPYIRQNLTGIVKEIVGQKAVINEAGLLPRIKQVLGAEPRQINESEKSNRLILNAVQRKFGAAAKSLGIDLEDIKQYQAITSKIKAKKATPQEIKYHNQLRPKLAKLFAELSPHKENPYKEEVLDAEIVDEPEKQNDNRDKLLEYLSSRIWTTPRGTKESLSPDKAKEWRQKYNARQIVKKLRHDKMISDRQAIILMKKFNI